MESNSVLTDIVSSMVLEFPSWKSVERHPHGWWYEVIENEELQLKKIDLQSRNVKKRRVNVVMKIHLLVRLACP